MEVTAGLTGLFQEFKDAQVQFQADQREQWAHQRRKDKLRALTQSLTPCDGELSSQTRNFLYDIDLILPQFERDNSGILKVVTRATSGALRREILRYLDDQPEDRENVPWGRLKAHIERTFLSADEEEKLRVEVEQLRQQEGETLASYNRRFREAVQRAYTGLRSADAERVVLRHYMRGLRSTELAKKLSLELKDQTLEAAIEFVDKVEAGLERYVGLNRDEQKEEPMDTSTVQIAPQSGQKETNPELLSTLLKIQRGQEKMAARLTQLEVGRHQGNEPRNWGFRQGSNRGNGNQPRSGNGAKQVSCFICGGPHYQIGCPRQSMRQRAAPRGSSRNTPGTSTQGN